MFWIVLCVVIVALCLLVHFDEAVRERARRHEDEWAPARIPGPSGLSDFQQSADERLRDALAAGGLAVADRRLVDLGEPHAHIEERVAGTPLTVWLYSDMAVVRGPDTALLLEEWDADTPAELADAVAARVARLAGTA